MRQYIYRFLARNRLSIRRVTRNVVLAEAEIERRASEFLDEVQTILAFEPGILFVNMDETAVYTDNQPRTTIESMGALNVPAHCTGTSDRVTAVLSVCSNGEKLQPMIIFKGTSNGRIARTIHSRNSPYPREAAYAMQPNAWMSEDIMVEWIERIFIPYTLMARDNNQRVVLILDTLRAHQTEEIRRLIRENHIQLLYIPGGLTGQLQPLDVGINGPLKHWLREEAASEDQSSQLTPDERRILIVQRVLRCWNRLDEEIVTNSFNHMLIRSADELDDFDEIE
jgi:hypothetical protein